ncbi:MAG: alpha/beta fold hydrolase, partial [Planctomycetota bacterium]
MLGWIRRHWRLSLCVYIAALALTLFIDWAHSESRSMNMSKRYIDWYDATWLDINAENLTHSRDRIFPYPVVNRGDPDDPRPPVVLLHGTPGAGFPLDDIALSLAQDGRRAIWFDLPGFASQATLLYTDYSADSYSKVVFAVLDDLGIERAHVVGWSNGGAVALRMAERDEDRLASITLLGSVGAQETEGSGNYVFEHGKYTVGYALLVWGAKVVPHFGILGPPQERVAFLRNFDDTDQRPLAGIMQNLRTPTLILHGRDDFLVADWAAEYHHELIPNSTLVMTGDDHFMPFLAAGETAGHIAAFVERFDDPAAAAERSTVDLAPRVKPFGEAGDAALHWLHFAPVLIVLPL